MSFDLNKFLAEHFRGGDPGSVVAGLRAAGVRKPPTEEAVRKWKQRNSVTGEWLAILLATVEQHRGSPVQMRPYIEATS